MASTRTRRGGDDEEYTFNDLRDGTGKNKVGYAKILFCGKQAQKDGLKHFWVDTCCINKESSAELSETINSMFGWYKEAHERYVYLPDVSTHKRDHNGDNRRSWEASLRKSRWFNRGWTLQELVAPETVEFYSREEERLGNKSDLCQIITEITGIPAAALQGSPLSDFSVSQKFQWAAKRDTRKVEDKGILSARHLRRQHAPRLWRKRQCRDPSQGLNKQELSSSIGRSITCR